MFLTRRHFLSLAASGIVGGFLPLGALADEQAARTRIKAVAFDAFPIFDPRPVFALAEQLFPGHGRELSDEWRTRQFEYTWLRVTAHDYADFWQVTRDALEFAAAKLKLDLPADKRDTLMNAYLALKSWPDVMPALATLKKSGLRLAILSNLTPIMLAANIKSAGLTGLFEHVLSTDQAQTYKPDPRAYQLGPDALGLKKEEILFAAFAGWDAAGAKLFGYPTFWVNRQQQPPEQLDAVPDGSGGTLADLVRFLS
jgi:2-haloacid dehalogenase